MLPGPSASGYDFMALYKSVYYYYYYYYMLIRLGLPSFSTTLCLKKTRH